MTRRFEAGPLLVALGAVVVLISLFLDWYDPVITAWEAFEVFDVLLTALAVGALAAALGLMAPEVAYVDRVWLPATVGAVLVIVASQLIQPPPAAADTEPAVGSWVALGGAVLMVIGTILTFGRVHFAFEVEGRDPRRRVAAVDARRERAAAAEEDEPAAAAAPPRPEPRRERVRPERSSPEPPSEDPAPAEPARRDTAGDPLATQPIDPPRPSRGGPLLGDADRRRGGRRAEEPAADRNPDAGGEER